MHNDVVALLVNYSTDGVK